MIVHDRSQPWAYGMGAVLLRTTSKTGEAGPREIGRGGRSKGDR